MSSRGASPQRSGGGSRSGSPARPSSSGGSPQPAAGWPKGPGHDPARLTSTSETKNTRVELPPDAYAADTKKSVFALRGSKFNTEGKPEQIELNQYRMKAFDLKKKIYQYDIALSPSPQKIVPVMKKIVAHPAFRAAFAKYNFPMWIFDGKKLAWAPILVDRGEVRVSVDLDEGQRSRRDNNKFLLVVRKTTEVDISALQGYLDHKIQFNNTIEAALNFLDHLVRQWPAANMLAIKRNFYKQSEKGRPLMDGAVVEVHKGIYTSLRMSHNITMGGVGLALNADIANTCFWVGYQTMDQLACNFLATCDKKYRGLTSANLAQHLKPIMTREGLEASDAFKHLRRLRRIRFTVKHPNRTANEDLYSSQSFTFDHKLGPEGANARTVKFDLDGNMTSIFDYYRSRYNVSLRFPNLPLIEAGKGGFIPMELAWIEPMQRYAFKLNPDQTAAMIKIAVTRPPVRRADIETGVAGLHMGNDPFLKSYGVQFEPQFTRTEARVIAPPTVNFGQGNADPKFSGRWDLRGKKFWKQNAAPLQSWGFIVMNGCVQLPQLQAFAKMFKSTFLGHGGRCTTDAMLMNCPGNIQNNGAEAVAWAHRELTKARGYTQLLFVVVQQRNSPHYPRLKKSADCRFGILTQVVNSQGVMACQGQFCSNICLKVHAKLGGATSRTMPPWKSAPTYFPASRPTMIVGVDVSHAAPGGVTPSFAAVTMSVDPDATRYAAAVQTNGYRVETLLPKNVHMMFGNLVQYWKAGHPGQFPKHIIYFRDGVGEGQFLQVLDQEIHEIRSYFRDNAPKQTMPKFTVIIATKRHHIRFFPPKSKGDRNGNPLPGTLVEKEVTHPFMFDFYLSSHVAIQGTARPVHYHVLLDEMNIPVNELQKMIYHQCYSYARSTTPVSLHPAIYYAHLAGARAGAHEQLPTSEGFRAGAKGHEMVRDKTAKGQSIGADLRGAEAPPLLQLGGAPEGQPVEGEKPQRDFFRSTMWYI